MNKKIMEKATGILMAAIAASSLILTTACTGDTDDSSSSSAPISSNNYAATESVKQNYLCDEKNVTFYNDDYNQTEVVTDDFWKKFSDYYMTISKGIELHNTSYDYSYHSDGSIINSGLIELYIYPDGYDSWYRIHWGWRLVDGYGWNNPMISYEIAAIYKIWDDGSLPFSLPDNDMNEFLEDLVRIYDTRTN